MMIENIEQIYLIVHGWNSQCGNCDYGGSSWADSPALKNKPILTPDSKSCPECKIKFTHIKWAAGYTNEVIEEI